MELAISLDPKNKKRLIALLLLCSCLTSIVILAFVSPSDQRSLQNFSHADSIIFDQIGKSNIPRKQVRVSTISVDSNLTRKKYTVRVAPGFSKTHFHAKLNERFYPLSVETPAKVLFPQRDMLIQLTYQGTVFRTITLRTDPELKLNPHRGSIMVAFDEIPDQKILEQIDRLSPSIPLVLKVHDIREARQLSERFQNRHHRIVFWLAGDSQNYDVDSGIDLPTLQQIQEFEPDFHFMQLRSSSWDGSSSNSQKKNISVVDARDAKILNTDDGEATFRETFSEFINRTRTDHHPVLIVMYSEQTMSWLKRSLEQLNEESLGLTYPPTIEY